MTVLDVSNLTFAVTKVALLGLTGPATQEAAGPKATGISQTGFDRRAYFHSRSF